MSVICAISMDGLSSLGGGAPQGCCIGYDRIFLLTAHPLPDQHGWGALVHMIIVTHGAARRHFGAGALAAVTFAAAGEATQQPVANRDGPLRPVARGEFTSHVWLLC